MFKTYTLLCTFRVFIILPSHKLAIDYINLYCYHTTKGTNIEGQFSRCVPLNHGVQQGPALGPPIAEIQRKLGIEFHVYGDDHQLYIAYQPTDKADVVVTKCTIRIHVD